jgi:hypothetical protein
MLAAILTYINLIIQVIVQFSRQKKYFSAVVLIVLISLILVLYNKDSILSGVRTGIVRLAMLFDIPPENLINIGYDIDPMDLINAKIRAVEQKLQTAATYQDAEYYKGRLQLLFAERDNLWYEQSEKNRQADYERWQRLRQNVEPEFTYSFPERTSNNNEVDFYIRASNDYVYSIEWRFAAYVIRNKSKTGNNPPDVKEILTMSDILNSGRVFWLGGVVLGQSNTGLLSSNKFIFNELKLFKPEWIATKITLESGEIFIGTIFTMLSPRIFPASAKEYQKKETTNFDFPDMSGASGSFMNIFPLSLADVSFSSVNFKKITEEYGLISMLGIFSPFIDPMGSMMARSGAVADFERHIAGEYRGFDYHVLAFKATGPRAVAHLLHSETSSTSQSTKKLTTGQQQLPSESSSPPSHQRRQPKSKR